MGHECVSLLAGNGYFEPISTPEHGVSELDQSENRVMASYLAQYTTQCIEIPTSGIGLATQSVHNLLGNRVKTNSEFHSLGYLEL